MIDLCSSSSEDDEDDALTRVSRAKRASKRARLVDNSCDLSAKKELEKLKRTIAYYKGKATSEKNEKEKLRGQLDSAKGQLATELHAKAKVTEHNASLSTKLANEQHAKRATVEELAAVKRNLVKEKQEKNAHRELWEKSARWQCLIDGAKWKDYDVDTTIALEDARLQGKDLLYFYRTSIKYVVDLRVMEQARKDGMYDTKRQIRRVLVPIGSDETDTADSTWTTPNSSGDYRFDKRALLSHALGAGVSRDSREFNIALGHFKRMGGGLAAKQVIQIDVYSNATLRGRFEAKKDEFRKAGKNSGEEWVFHNTPSDANIVPIMRDGLKVGGQGGISVAHGAAHGSGIYTSKSTVNSYTGSTNKAILARALPGTQIGGASSQHAPHADSFLPNGDWVIYKDGSQLLPTYVIHFQ